VVEIGWRSLRVAEPKRFQRWTAGQETVSIGDDQKERGDFLVLSQIFSADEKGLGR
jgi:hypothetical protein